MTLKNDAKQRQLDLEQQQHFQNYEFFTEKWFIWKDKGMKFVATDVACLGKGAADQGQTKPVDQLSMY